MCHLSTGRATNLVDAHDSVFAYASHGAVLAVEFCATLWARPVLRPVTSSEVSVFPVGSKRAVRNRRVRGLVDSSAVPAATWAAIVLHVFRIRNTVFADTQVRVTVSDTEIFVTRNA